jgi:acetylornithine/N-succinyldiaminopimelate aminotransferase
MTLFDVYPLFNVGLTKGKGCFVWDDKGTRYLDFYGGHAVISIGHTNEHYVQRITAQLEQLAFYSNSVRIPIQDEYATLLGRVSGYDDYHLFLCNSGAEAVENALKVASFVNGRKMIIAFKGAFHGRTSGAVAITDNPAIKPPVNDDAHVLFLNFNDSAALEKAFAEHDICAVIIEPIQGVNGIYEPTPEFLKDIQRLCQAHGAFFIADEIQCGFGRSGQFFAHQLSGVQPDLITMAKGMGNGFPIAGVLIHPEVAAKYGMLGTTFGGAPLACAAGLAVLEEIEKHQLIPQAATLGNYLMDECRQLPEVKEVRGKGLMIGVEFNFPIKALREKLVYEHHIFVGNSSNPNTLRLLPSLTITKEEIDLFLEAIKKCLA